MTKKDAIKLFGSVRELATAIGQTTQAVYKWPNTLNRTQMNHISAALVRSGKTKEAKKWAM